MCGICHSDAHFYSEKEYKHFLPRVLGNPNHIGIFFTHTEIFKFLKDNYKLKI